MRILLVNQFCPPDMAPTGQVMLDLAQALVERGHEVSVLCSRKSYDGGGRYAARELVGGVRVLRVSALGFGRRRLLGRLLDYATFYMALAGRLLWIRPRPDVVVSLTTPPYVGLLARILGGLRGWTCVSWPMDLYPDVLAAHGALDTGGLAYRLLDALSRWELTGSRLIVCPGPDVRGRILERLGPSFAVDTVRWVPLWADRRAHEVSEAERRAERLRKGWADDDFVIMYSGNMGMGHRFGEFLRAAVAMGGNRRIRWCFTGGGRRRVDIEWFIRDHPGLRIELLPYVEWERLAVHLSAADLHLASLDDHWQGCILPCKLQGIFAVGRPVVLVGGRENSISQWILESGAGWVVPSGDDDGLRRAIEEGLRVGERERRGRLAREFSAKRFDFARNTDTMARWIEEIGDGAPGRVAEQAAREGGADV